MGNEAHLTLVDITWALVEVGEGCHVGEYRKEICRGMFNVSGNAWFNFFRFNGNIHVHLLKRANLVVLAIE